MRFKKPENRIDGQCSAFKCRAESELIEDDGSQDGKDRLEFCQPHYDRYCVEDAAPKPRKKKPKQAEKEPDQIEETKIAAMEETEEAKAVLALVQKFLICDQETYDFADEALGEIKARAKVLESKKQAATKPLNAALREIRSWFRPAIDHYAECERVWKAKIRDYTLARKVEQQKALEEAQAKFQADDQEGLQQAIQKSTEAEVAQSKNISLIENWKFEIVDPSAIPHEYCSPDPRKIRGVVDALKEKAQIPGVRIYREDTVVKRGA